MKTIVLVAAAALVGFLSWSTAVTWVTVVLGLAYLGITGALLSTGGQHDGQ